MQQNVLPTLPQRQLESRGDYPNSAGSEMIDTPIGYRFHALLKQHAIEKGNLISLKSPVSSIENISGNHAYGRHLYVKGGGTELSEAAAADMDPSITAFVSTSGQGDEPLQHSVREEMDNLLYGTNLLHGKNVQGYGCNQALVGRYTQHQLN